MNSEIVSLIRASSSNILVLQISFIVVCTFVVVTILKFSASKLLTRIPTNSIRYTFYKELIFFIKRPLVTIMWVWSISMVLSLLAEKFYSPIVKFMDSGRVILISLIAGLSASGLVNNISREMTKISIEPTNSYDKVTIEILTKMAKCITFSIALVFILQAVGVSVGAILAVSGISGVALGFSLRDLLASFFGMIVLYSDKPFVVGDRIKMNNMPQGSGYGYVEQIEWRITAIRTSAGKLVYIPNYLFCVSTVENMSRTTHSEIIVNIDVQNVTGTTLSAAMDSLRSNLLKNSKVIESKDVSVEIKGVSNDVISLTVTCYSYDIKDMAVTNLKNEVFLKSIDVMKEHGIELASDHRMLVGK